MAVAAPRGHAKSTAVTHAYVLASVLFRESDHVLIISDTDLQAIAFLSDIKMELEKNEHLQKLFEINGFEKDSEREIIVNCGSDGHTFRILAKGASGGTGKTRGLKWNNKRPNLVVCDDIENDEAVLNEERRSKFREWFHNAYPPRS